MGFKTDMPDRLEAVAYTRDYSATSVLDDIKEGNTESFSEEPESVSYYHRDDWKVYKVTITIEPVG